MKKGEVVFCCAEVFTEYEIEYNASRGWELLHRPSLDGNYIRCLYRRPLYNPIQVFVLGKTSIQTGSKRDGFQSSEDCEPNYLQADKHHSVWVVSKYTPSDNRYYKPFYILESDLVEE